MEEKNRNHSSLVVLACLVVAVLCCVGVLVFKQLSKNSTPKSLFINSIFNKVKFENKEYKTFSIDGSIKLNIESELLDESISDLINKLDLNYTISSDNTNNTALIKVDSNYDNSKLFNGNIYVNKEGETYLYLADIFNKWIKLNFDNSISNVESEALLNNFNLSEENINNFIDEFKNIIINSLRNDYFTKEKEDELTKITFTLNEDNIYDIINNLINNCDKDTSFKKVVKETFGVDSDYVFSEMKKSFNEVTKENFKGMEEIKFISYTDKNNNIKKFVLDTMTEETPIKLEIAFNDDGINAVVYMMGIKFMTLEEKKVKDGDTTTDNFKFDMFNMMKFDMTLKYTIKYDGNIEKVDVSEYVDSNNLTEKDLTSIEEKIYSNEGIIKFIEAVQNMTMNNADMLDSDVPMIEF